MDRNIYKQLFSKVSVSDSIVSTLIQKAIEQDNQVENIKPQIVKRRMKRKMKRKLVALIAIISILSITIAAYSLGASTWFTQLFQKDNIELDDKQKQTLDEIGNNLTISKKSNDTLFTVRSVIGDSTNCYIYCELTAPEDKVLNAFNNCQFSEVDIEIKNKGEFYSIGHSLMNIVNESSNKISFIMEIVTSGDVNMIDNVVSLRLKDFGYADVDENGEKYFLVEAKGEWDLDIPTNYSNNKVNLFPQSQATIGGYKATITRIMLTPIILNIDYAFPYDEDPNTKYSFLFYDNKDSYLITDKDEKLYIINDVSLTAEWNDALKTDCIFYVQYELSKPTDVEHIKAVVIHGNEIPLK